MSRTNIYYFGTHMLQTVPLTPALSVDVKFIIKAVEADLLEGINDPVFKRFSSKRRKLSIDQGPVQLD